MLLTEYNEAEQMELFRKEGREEGRKEGKLEEKMNTAVRMHGMGFNSSDIARITGADVKLVHQWINNPGDGGTQQ